MVFNLAKVKVFSWKLNPLILSINCTDCKGTTVTLTGGVILIISTEMGQIIITIDEQFFCLCHRLLKQKNNNTGRLTDMGRRALVIFFRTSSSLECIMHVSPSPSPSQHKQMKVGSNMVFSLSEGNTRHISEDKPLIGKRKKKKRK